MIVNGQEHEAYFVHQLKVEDMRQVPRLDVFLPLVAGKNVLHVGNVDWPITDRANSLHVQLSKAALRIDGVDPNLQGAEAIRVPNGEQFQDWSQLKGRKYDWIFVPEVVEHVGSFRELFEHLDSVSGMLLMTAPCAWACQSFFEKRAPDHWIEVVHPDHNCWFSPYTLKNLIEKYGRRRVKSLFWINKTSIVAVAG